MNRNIVTRLGDFALLLVIAMAISQAFADTDKKCDGREAFAKKILPDFSSNPQETISGFLKALHNPEIGTKCYFSKLQQAFEPHLDPAKEHAPGSIPVIANELGNIYARADRWGEALDCYQIAIEKGTWEARIGTELNRARLLPPRSRVGYVKAQLEPISKEIKDPAQRLRLYLNARAVLKQRARSVFNVEQTENGACPRTKARDDVASKLDQEDGREVNDGHSKEDAEAVKAILCKAAGDVPCDDAIATVSPLKVEDRLLAEFYSALAEDLAKTPQDALDLSTKALMYLKTPSRRGDSLYLEIQARRAKALANMGQTKQAFEIFRLATHAIDLVREALPDYTDRSHDAVFDLIDQTYQEFIGALLTEAKLLANGKGKTKPEKHQAVEKGQKLAEQCKKYEECLKEALDLQEKRTLVQQQEYLGDHCIVERETRQLEDLPAKTMALYTIVLGDDRLGNARIALITQSAEGIKLLEDPPDAKKLKELVNAVRRDLLVEAPKTEVDPRLQELYARLFGPLNLNLEQIKTLIVVPDGWLRLVPYAALRDTTGKYAIERVAIGIVPGRRVLGRNPTDIAKGSVLIAGVSKFRQMAEPAGGVKPTMLEDLRSSAQRQGLFLDALEDLPGVATEMDDLEALFKEAKIDSKPLPEENFTKENFSAALKDPNTRIIHIASHGWFGERGEDNFVVAYDQLLDRDSWPSEILSRQRGNSLRDNPIELVTLSACQTAQGSDRAPLGLVGAAIRARARSALGSLWPVRDDAARVLMKHFYTELLGTAKQEKVRALQQAQINMIKSNDERFQHPASWASFVLVGNWR